MRHRSALDSGDGGNDREHFVFPDPLSPVTERGTSSAVDTESNESTSRESTVAEGNASADHCDSPRHTRAQKGKGIARDLTPATNSQEPYFLPLLKEDSRFPRQAYHENKTHTSRSNSFHIKLANLNKPLTPAATTPEVPKQPAPSREAERDQKVLRHLRLQTLIQSDQIKSLKLQTKDIAETLKRLQGSTARDIQSLEESSEIQRESFDRLMSGWEGMRHELLELELSMTQDKSGQRVLGRDGDEGGDGDRRGADPDLPFPPPHSLLQPAPVARQDYAYPYPYSFPDPRYSNPQSTTSLNSNHFPVVVDDPSRSQDHVPTGNNSGSSWAQDPIAGPTFSRTAPASHGVDPFTGYSSAPLHYMDQHRQSHMLQNPQGCRWSSCSVCQNDGERGVWFE
jgi:hypothetical protein